VFAICDKHGLLFDLELGPANTDDRTGTLPVAARNDDRPDAQSRAVSDAD
jgi:hypothetical protein